MNPEKIMINSPSSPQQIQGIEDGEHALGRMRSMECTSTEVRILKAVLVSDGSKKGFTSYVIQVKLARSWMIQRRFSDFVRLDQQIGGRHPGMKLPQLPPKRIFGSSLEPKFVEERRALLEVYLQNLVGLPNVWNQIEMVRFLDTESNLLLYIWNVDRMRKMQEMLSIMSLENVRFKSNPNAIAEIRATQDQLTLLQSRISHMEMLFLQHATGVAKDKLSSTVMRTISRSSDHSKDVPADIDRLKAALGREDGDDSDTDEAPAKELLQVETDAANHSSELDSTIQDYVDSGESMHLEEVIQALDMAYGRSSSSESRTSSSSSIAFAVSVKLQEALRIADALKESISDDSLSASDDAQSNKSNKSSNSGNSSNGSGSRRGDPVGRATTASEDLSLSSGVDSGGSGGSKTAQDDDDFDSGADLKLHLPRHLRENKHQAVREVLACATTDDSPPPRWYSKLVEEVDVVVSALVPTLAALDARHRVFHYLRGMVCSTLGMQLFPVGSFVSNTFLPSSDLDVTVFAVRAEDECWFVRVNEALCMSSFEASKPRPSSPSVPLEGDDETKETPTRVVVQSVSFVNADIKLVRSCVNTFNVEISANQLQGAYGQALIIQLDEFVGKGHLLKRSILLIKAWCTYEANRFTSGSDVAGACEGRLSSWMVTVMVLSVFNAEGATIAHPIQALGHFLKTFARWDWNKFAVTINGATKIADRTCVNTSPFFPPHVVNQYSERYDLAMRSCIDSQEHPQQELQPSPPPPLGSVQEEEPSPANDESPQPTALPASQPNADLEADTSKATGPASPPLNWGSRGAFGEGLCAGWVQGPMVVVDPVVVSCNVSRHVDVGAAAVIRRLINSGYAAYTAVCTQLIYSDDVESAPDAGKMLFPLTCRDFVSETKARSLALAPAPSTDPKSPDSESFDPLQSQLDEVEASIEYAELVVASVIHHSALIRLMLQIIAQKGPMPVGEVGKHLHLITGSHAISRRLKENYQGLKKAIEAAKCPFFEMRSDHPFNPTVSLVPSSVRLPAAAAPTNPIHLFDHKTFQFPDMTESLALSERLKGSRNRRVGGSVSVVPSSPSRKKKGPTDDMSMASVVSELTTGRSVGTRSSKYPLPSGRRRDGSIASQSGFSGISSFMLPPGQGYGAIAEADSRDDWDTVSAITDMGEIRSECWDDDLASRSPPRGPAHFPPRAMGPAPGGLPYVGHDPYGYTQAPYMASPPVIAYPPQQFYQQQQQQQMFYYQQQQQQYQQQVMMMQSGMGWVDPVAAAAGGAVLGGGGLASSAAPPSPYGQSPPSQQQAFVQQGEQGDGNLSGEGHSYPLGRGHPNA